MPDEGIRFGRVRDNRETLIPVAKVEGWVRTVVKLTFGGRHKWLGAPERRQADARPEGLARPLVAGGKDQHAARNGGPPQGAGEWLESRR